MSNKKNKSKNKPAVPVAAGNNNKKAKNAQGQKNSASEKSRNRAADYEKKQAAAQREREKKLREAQKRREERAKIEKEKQKQLEKQQKKEQKQREKNSRRIAKSREKSKKQQVQESSKQLEIKEKELKKSAKTQAAQAKKTLREEKAVKKKASFKKFTEKYSLFKIGVAVVLVAAVITGIVFGVDALVSSRVTVPDSVKNAQYNGRLEPESTAFKINLSQQQQMKLAKSVSAKGSKRAFDFFVNESIKIDTFSDPALLEFGSVETNDCVLLIFLIDEAGNIVYRSLGIEPGREISSVNFYNELPYGKQKLTLAVNGYDAKSYKKIATKTVEISLEIGVSSDES